VIRYGDGVTNLMKYALNLNPQGPDATPMIPMGTRGLPLVAPDPSRIHLTLTFVRRTAANSGISYQVRFANDLGSQNSFLANPEATASATPIDNTWERVTVTDSIGFTDHPKRFERLTVTKP
jgi:hypothetical protein